MIEGVRGTSIVVGRYDRRSKRYKYGSRKGGSICLFTNYFKYIYKMKTQK